MSVVSAASGTRRKWTGEETEEFYDAVRVVGVGHWAAIKEYLDTSRTGVNLKDKWRNMIKSGEIEEIRRKRAARGGKN